MKLYDLIIDLKVPSYKPGLRVYNVLCYPHYKCASSLLSCNEGKYTCASVIRRTIWVK